MDYSKLYFLYLSKLIRQDINACFLAFLCFCFCTILFYALISEWKIPADSLDMPYYMFLDGNEMQVKDMFIPVKENLSLSRLYIETLNRQYGK